MNQIWFVLVRYDVFFDIHLVYAVILINVRLGLPFLASGIGSIGNRLRLKYVIWWKHEVDY